MIRETLQDGREFANYYWLKIPQNYRRIGVVAATLLIFIAACAVTGAIVNRYKDGQYAQEISSRKQNEAVLGNQLTEAKTEANVLRQEVVVLTKTLILEKEATKQAEAARARLEIEYRRALKNANEKVQTYEQNKNNRPRRIDADAVISDDAIRANGRKIGVPVDDGK